MGSFFMGVFALAVVYILRKQREGRAANQHMQEEQQSSETHHRYSERLEATETPKAVEREIDALEQERQALHKKITRQVKISGGALVAVALLLAVFTSADAQLMIPLLMLGGTGILLYSCWQSARLRQRAKRQLMDKLCGDLGLAHALTVDKEKVKKFENLGLLPSYSRARPSDYIHGETLAGHRFELIDVELIRSGGKDSSDTTVFSGLLIHVDSQSSIKDQILIKKRSGIKALNPFESRNKVTLESDEFSAIYDVYASDQVAARRLLTPRIMEECVALDRKTGGTPQIAFTQGKLYLAIDRGQTSFDIPRLGEPWTGKIFERSLSELTFAIEVAGVFDHELQPA